MEDGVNSIGKVKISSICWSSLILWATYKLSVWLSTIFAFINPCWLLPQTILFLYVEMDFRIICSILPRDGGEMDVAVVLWSFFLPFLKIGETVVLLWTLSQALTIFDLGSSWAWGAVLLFNIPSQFFFSPVWSSFFFFLIWALFFYHNCGLWWNTSTTVSFDFMHMSWVQLG